MGSPLDDYFEERWKTLSGLCVDEPPQLGGNGAVFVAGKGGVACLDGRTGAQRWRDLLDCSELWCNGHRCIDFWQDLWCQGHNDACLSSPQAARTIDTSAAFATEAYNICCHTCSGSGCQDMLKNEGPFHEILEMCESWKEYHHNGGHPWIDAMSEPTARCFLARVL